MTETARIRTLGKAVRRLAEQAGLPHLREFIVSQHVVLYAHSEAETEVVLLAIKHQRQLVYSAEI